MKTLSACCCEDAHTTCCDAVVLAGLTLSLLWSAHWNSVRGTCHLLGAVWRTWLRALHATWPVRVCARNVRVPECVLRLRLLSRVVQLRG